MLVHNHCVHKTRRYRFRPGWRDRVAVAYKRPLSSPTSRTCLMTQPKPGPRIAITYCSMCNWLLRSAWMAQELLQTFGQDLGEVVLIPRTGGIFHIHYDGELIWDRTVDGGFPDVKQLKQRVRDRLDPERDLGHLDDHRKTLAQG